jgi:hypothetical protein
MQLVLAHESYSRIILIQHLTQENIGTPEWGPSKMNYGEPYIFQCCSLRFGVVLGLRLFRNCSFCTCMADQTSNTKMVRNTSDFYPLTPKIASPHELNAKEINGLKEASLTLVYWGEEARENGGNGGRIGRGW